MIGPLPVFPLMKGRYRMFYREFEALRCVKFVQKYDFGTILPPNDFGKGENSIPDKTGCAVF